MMSSHEIIHAAFRALGLNQTEAMFATADFEARSEALRVEELARLFNDIRDFYLHTVEPWL